MILKLKVRFGDVDEYNIKKQYVKKLILKVFVTKVSIKHHVLLS